LLFKKIVDLINKKEHLTIEGLQKIITIKYSLNKGLSHELKEAFPVIVSIQKPSVELPENLNPY